MKQLLVLALALTMVASPVAAQETGGDGQGGILQGFGEWVSGIAGSGVNLSQQVVGRLSETLNAGKASQALNNAVSRIGGPNDETRQVPDTGQDARPSNERQEEKGIIPNNVVEGLVS